MYAACYPSTFDPDVKYDPQSLYGNPQFEPNLKAGGSWNAQLTVPEDIRESAASVDRRKGLGGLAPSVTWIVEISSQVLFSTTAAVHYEVLVGRDEKSLDFGFAGLAASPHSVPGQLSDHQESRSKKGHGSVTPKGVFSKAIKIVVDDTAGLWNKPKLPEWDFDHAGQDPWSRPLDETDPKHTEAEEDPSELEQPKTSNARKRRKRKKVHLVVLTHGLHSNLGADMLYLKEHIDLAAQKARLDSKMRKAMAKSKKKEKGPSASTEPASKKGGRETGTERPHSRDVEDDEEEDDEEEVIVRGFSGNAARTERGIQYLGKRLAKYILSITYPDQPCFPVKKSVGKSLSRAFGNSDNSAPSRKQTSHGGSTVVKKEADSSNLPYQITSISLIGHSLGGLTQTYAIAYIHKHSPEFFECIKPVNFVALATPFLGLSNENPLYVKFALDFGLVGRTGRDLGLTWRPPTMVRSGWDAMIAGIGTEGQRKHKMLDPGSKPLLRILPSGPAHEVLKMFRNRTVYSNVVNDGIVPLRTSCLLFLDWRGLGRVEKARRENGLVGTMAEWGWAELTGLNASEQQKFFGKGLFDGALFSSGENSGDGGSNTPVAKTDGEEVPQPAENATSEEDAANAPNSPQKIQFLSPQRKQFQDEDTNINQARPTSPLAGFFNLFKPAGSSSNNNGHDTKQNRIYRRGQTIKVRDETGGSEGSDLVGTLTGDQPSAEQTRSTSQNHNNVFAPPKTTLFEAAGDVLSPPIPNKDFLNDPTSRPRTIFHDRVYHPDDIPIPPPKPRGSPRRLYSSDGPPKTASTTSSSLSVESGSSVATDDGGSMKVEEKIARAYHRDMSWRKVLVRLEPDAHNNIVVRRMFSNAYGWPVVKHLVDTHFGDTYSARTADTYEPNMERANPVAEAVGADGEEVKEQPASAPRRPSSADATAGSSSGARNDANQPPVLRFSEHSPPPHGAGKRHKLARADSAQWDERFFESDGEPDSDEHEEFEPPRSPVPGAQRVEQEGGDGSSGAEQKGTGIGAIQEFLEQKPAEGRKTEASGLVVAPALTQSPTATAVGLRKSLEEQLERAKIDGMAEGKDDGAIGKDDIAK